MFTILCLEFCAKKQAALKSGEEDDMEYIPLDRIERKVLKKLRKRDKNMVGKTIQRTELSLKENLALIRLRDSKLVFQSDMFDEDNPVFGLTELGRRTAIYDSGERFWKTTTFIIPTVISILALIIPLLIS